MMNLMNIKTVLVIFSLATSASISGCGNSAPGDEAIELLNLSCDPTRELWRDVNQAFIPEYEKETGKRVTIRQSHGGSGSQSRAVIDGLAADVVTLALWSDTDAIRAKGLIDAGWEKRFPNDSLPYLSTIVFVVRKGNPKGIKDWADLVRYDVKIITPNPKTSGNGRLSFLAAWGAVLHRQGSEAQAREFVTRLYRQVPVLDAAARGSTTTFAQRKIGDVHLTWENEAYLELAEAKGELEIVYPSCSIRAEPPVAVVDANARRKGTVEAATAYVNFMYSAAAQEIMARHHYRPTRPDILQKYAADFPAIELFPVTLVARDWDDAQQKFFADKGIFDSIYDTKQ
jgi:sulfate/thiosulfate transport system substrate-binding protein